VRGWEGGRVWNGWEGEEEGTCVARQARGGGSGEGCEYLVLSSSPLFPFSSQGDAWRSPGNERQRSSGPLLPPREPLLPSLPPSLPPSPPRPEDLREKQGEERGKRGGRAMKKVVRVWKKTQERKEEKVAIEVMKKERKEEEGKEEKA